MTPVYELKKIVMLGYLTAEMLKKISHITNKQEYGERDYVFREGDIADGFYMLQRGKVIFEKKLSDSVTVSVGALKPGYSFGWSSMVGAKSYTSDAVCAEPSVVLQVNKGELRKLLDEDHSMGYIFTQRLLRIMSSRLDHRTEQFLLAIKNQPEIHALL